MATVKSKNKNTKNPSKGTYGNIASGVGSVVGQIPGALSRGVQGVETMNPFAAPTPSKQAAPTGGGQLTGIPGLGGGQPNLNAPPRISPWQQAAVTKQNQDRAAQAALAAQPPKSFADYMAQAAQLDPGQSADTGAFDSGIAQANTQGAANDALLSSIYQNLQNQIGGDASTIQSQHAATGSALQQGATQDEGTIQGGYQAGDNQLAGMLQKLGMGDALTKIANDGNQAGGDEGAALANIATKNGAAQTANAQDLSGALDYNNSYKTAAGSQGAIERALSQTNMNKQVDSLELQKAQAIAAANQSNSAQQISLAQYLQSQDPTTTANQIAESNAASKKAAATKSSSSSSGKTTADYYMQALKQTNGDPAKAKAIIDQMVKQGILTN